MCPTSATCLCTEITLQHEIRWTLSHPFYLLTSILIWSNVFVCDTAILCIRWSVGSLARGGRLPGHRHAALFVLVREYSQMAYRPNFSSFSSSWPPSLRFIVRSVQVKPSFFWRERHITWSVVCIAVHRQKMWIFLQWNLLQVSCCQLVCRRFYRATASSSSPRSNGDTRIDRFALVTLLGVDRFIKQYFFSRYKSENETIHHALKCRKLYRSSREPSWGSYDFFQGSDIGEQATLGSSWT